MIQSNSERFKNIELKVDDELDLKVIFDFLFRNKILIGLISFLSLLFATIYESNLKKTYQGEFQIVLNREQGTSIDINPALRNFIGFGAGKSNDLKTEVGILGSPSILMPIFDYVSLNKKEKNENLDLVFKNWAKNNLDIFLEPGTSILNISYKDEDKELIIPVLNRISSTYQDYSSKNKKKSQELTRNYLKSKIKEFKIQSAESLRIAQEFAIDQDLIFFDNAYNNKSLEDVNNEANVSSNMLLPNIQIESIRVQAANEIRKLDLQIENINNLGDDLQKLQFIGANIPEIIKEGLPSSLAEIEEELVEKRAKYTDSDIAIKQLIEKKELLIDLLKKRSIGFLKAKRSETEALMKSAMRPKGILLKYKELVRQAQRDESTLITLENQFSINELDESKSTRPWELITKPTLLRNPVYPDKKKIQLIGLLIGLIIANGAAFYKEKKSDKIYDINKLRKLLRFEFLEEISFEDIKFDSRQIQFLRELIEINSLKRINLINLGEIENFILEKLKDVINEGSEKSFDIQIVSELKNLSLTSNSDINLVVSELNLIKLSDIEILKNHFSVFKSELKGIILVNNKN